MSAILCCSSLDEDVNVGEVCFLSGLNLLRRRVFKQVNAVSPVSDSVLQLIQDSAVQSINIRQLIENLSKPVLM